MDVAILLDHLNGARRHVLGILDGLDEEAMRRPVLPSGWSCRQLVHHLALDDERFWFQGVVAGRQAVKDWVAEDAGDGWNPPADLTGEEILALYRAEITRSDEVILATALDAKPAWWPDFFGTWRLDDFGEVLLHVLTETATHAGHLDAARELLDGRQWMVVG
ncbi:DUF664 domain-containing protein [Solihabitans fulvus]|uniref:DUF664 domain-containing protein n=1 Tax=Solihabitans fulvus TaxID=1892852 RepID=A0A5B2XGT1_9PSEU|nr:DUF664 domain-containing protein [Solihabitans fulvus]KAA2262603.1 DUF664 domain-containing protein [Solihabitans fulvus]